MVGGELTKWAADGGGGFTSGGVDVPSAIGRGQEARGGGEVVLVACLRRRKRGGERKGQATSVMSYIGAVGGRGRREGGLGRSPRGRERRTERGGGT
jgi:hypothetical protein